MSLEKEIAQFVEENAVAKRGCVLCREPAKAIMDALLAAMEKRGQKVKLSRLFQFLTDKGVEVTMKCMTNHLHRCEARWAGIGE